jgi:hypothetical protein
MTLNDILHYAYKCLIMYIMSSQVSLGIIIPITMEPFLSSLFPA